MLDYSQLKTLLAIDETGSFEAAARLLRVSSFAVSQRIKQLEKSLGVRLVERGPTRTSEVGKVLCNHTREVSALESGLLERHRLECLNTADGAPVLKLALNDESLSGWFVKVLQERLAIQDPALFDISLACPRCSNDLMLSGDVLAAISDRKNPINGFRSYSLFNSVYHAVATPDFVDVHFANGVTIEAISRAPCLRYCKNDALASSWLAQEFPGPVGLPYYNFPSSYGAVRICLEGHAWTMAPSEAVQEHLATGALIEILPDTPLNRPLYWHVAGAVTETLAQFTKSIRGVALENHGALYPP